MSTEQLLSERLQTHGDYSNVARYSQTIKQICHGSPNWKYMTPCQRETLDMVANKLGRILSGDANFEDHWRDIAGYAQLTAERLA